MCNCMTWGRVPTDANGGKYPMSAHHPNCEDFKLEEFTVLRCEGSSCVMEPHEAAAAIEEGAASEVTYEVSTVMLTRDQFERLPEFNGF